MKTLVGPWAEARKGRDNSLLGGGAGGGVQDGAKARAAATDHQITGAEAGGGEESDGGSTISALGEGWSNGEDSVPALGARFDGRDIVSALGSPQV